MEGSLGTAVFHLLSLFVLGKRISLIPLEAEDILMRNISSLVRVYTTNLNMDGLDIMRMDHPLKLLKVGIE